MHNNRNRKIKQRIISVAFSVALLTNSLPLSGVSELLSMPTVITASAYTDESVWTDKHNYNFQSADEFVSYCHWYATDTDFANDHKSDSISIALNNAVLSGDFPGLGSSAYPFEGTVTFADSTSLSITTNRAFFSYLSDKATIVGSGGSTSFTLIINRTQDVAADTSAPVLADHVVHHSDVTVAKGWKVQVIGSSTFSGAIGEIRNGALVDLTFTNNTGKSIESKAAYDAETDSVSDVGLFCGSMGSNSVFTVKYISSNAISHSTTSSNGNAGTFIGTMASGATLNIISDVNSISSAVTANGAEANDKGYAGGLVGSMDSSALVQLKATAEGNANRDLSTLEIGGSVTGNNGVGGFYGKYGFSSVASIDLNDYNTTATVSGKYCGGLFGVLETTGGLTLTSSNTTKSYSYSTTSTGKAGYFGGVIGKLTANSLTDTILLQNLNVNPTANASFTSFGGVIGIVDSAAYVQVSNVEVTATGMEKREAADFFGGVIGTTSSENGVFVDLGDFTLSANGYYGGGIVGKFNKGVLRLTGTTDMTSAKPAGTASSTATNGQLVGVNDNVLVYTPGGWTYSRSTNAIADDLGTWGEVVRLSGIETDTETLDPNAILTLNTTAHTVTVSEVTVSNDVAAISTQTDLVKTALNMQLDSCGCLIMPSTRTAMYSTNLSLSADLSFARTGITGFMRDGGELSTIGCYTGIFDGDDNAITLAIGEKYGNGINSDSSGEGIGQIYRHQYNGLFSVLGGTVKNLTLSHEGYINVRNCVDGMNIGGIAACNGGNVTLTKITANETINYYEGASISGTETAGKNIGGLIGLVGTDGTNSITINGVSSIGATINHTGYHQGWSVYGGAIGKVTAETFNITVGTANDNNNKLTVGMSADVSGVTTVGANSDCGGLIGHITNADSYGSRIVNINNLIFDDVTVNEATKTPTIGNAATTNGGGFLGYSWLNSTVNINGLTVTKGIIDNHTTNGAVGGNSNIGVMCYEATGRWNVDKLTVTNITMSNGGGTSVGMLVNNAFKGDDGLYLNVLNSGYTLTAATLPSLAKFDELAAYSAASADAVIAGGDGVGVVSINMNAARTGTTNSRISTRTVGETTTVGTGTYQNQLTGITCSQTSKFANSTTRYYYNLDVMGNTDGGENLTLWSVKKYAPTNLKSEFVTTIADDNISGTADLTGLSFYPLAKADGYTIGDLALTFDYSGIYTSAETIYNATYNKNDSYIRDPGATVVTSGETTTDNRNQHYLMHSGLFIDSSADTSLTVSGALSLSGTFLEVGNYKGVLISDTMRGSFNSSSGSISLNGITPKSTGNVAFGSGSFTEAYLLINNIKRADAIVGIPTLTLHNVSTGSGYAYSGTVTTTVANSLIGKAEGPGLNMDFKYIKLDGRISNSITGTSAQISALDTAYNTYNSIFSTSTLLSSIKTDQNAQLIYNYTVAHDWTEGRKVTYGAEVSMTTGCEYPGQEDKYFGSDTYTNPTEQTGGTYDFSGFRPYVATHYTAIDPNALYFRDLKVNVVAKGLTEGCGTYNDPYIISEKSQLINVAAFLQDNTYASTLGKVNLPLTVPVSMTNGDRWCTDKSGNDYHGTYTISTSSNGFDKPSTTAAAWTNIQVQSYLASAYYKVTTNIPIDSSDNFAGLGGATAATAFRGVIVGKPTTTTVEGVTTTSYPTITVSGNNPFINVSNGCVVKDLNIVVNSDITRVQKYNTQADAYFDYAYDNNEPESNVCKFYGGVIGEIMGGDNIIDNTYVTFGSKTVTLSGASGTIVPVGGYVGVVVFGGLIFKNMDARKTTLASTGLKVYYKDTDEVLHSDNNLAANDTKAKAAIYVNPIVGRVINGYAVNETGGNAKNASGAAVKQFSVTEDGKYHDESRTSGRSGNQHTLKNGTKHYSIADIDPYYGKTAEQWNELTDAEKNALMLDVTPPESTSADGIINVPNSQAMFILSLITQSTAGTATDKALGAYNNSLSYGSTTTAVYGMSHNAEYSDVGTDTALTDDDPETTEVDERNITDYQKIAAYDTANNAEGNAPIPYIIKHYTVGGTTTGTTSRTETRTREWDETVYDEIIHYTKTKFEGTTIPSNTKFVLKGTRTTDAEYLTNIEIRPGAGQTNVNYRNCVLKSTYDYNAIGVLTADENKMKNATEFYFESNNDGKYCIYYLDDNNQRKYLAISNVVSPASSNINRGNLEISDNPCYFTVSNESNKWLFDWNERKVYYDGGKTYFSGYKSSDDGAKFELYEVTETITQVPRVVHHEEEYDVEIVEYTTTHNYPARCVTSTLGYYDINLTGSGTYQLPDSFRGLGTVGYYDDSSVSSMQNTDYASRLNNRYCMKVDIFNGNNITIDEDIYLNRYVTDNYFSKLHNSSNATQAVQSGLADYSVNTNTAFNGIGMFDSIVMKDANSKLDNFNLSGSINTAIFSNTYSASSQEQTGANNSYMWHSVGGVVGSSINGTRVNFSRIALNNFSVRGSSYIGGLLGHSGNKSTQIYIIIDRCSATGLKLDLAATDDKEKYRDALGGFVGKVKEGGVKIYGTEYGDNCQTGEYSTVELSSVSCVNSDRAGAGGLVGYAGNGCEAYDMHVDAAEGCEVTIGGSAVSMVGGIVGSMQPAEAKYESCNAIFSNCEINKINFAAAEYAGGIYGGAHNNSWSPYSIKVTNCRVTGNSTTNNTITATNYAGGLIGDAYIVSVAAEGSANVEIADTIVSNYTISTLGNNTAAGGFIGYADAYTEATGKYANNSVVCYIYNSSVENCQIAVNGKFGGGALGKINKHNSNKVLGYNIKLDNVTSTSSSMGAWIGWVDTSDSTTSIQFTGVGIYGNGFAQNVGNRANFSNASFVFADYEGACGSMTSSNAGYSTFNASESSNVAMPKYPYVNVNPQSDLGSDEIISGDGAVLYGSTVTGFTGTGKNTMAAKIYSEMATHGTTKQYYTTFNAANQDIAVSGRKINYYMNRSTSDEGDRISTFAIERGMSAEDLATAGFDNFAVLVIATANEDETTDLINRYIQLVTNTTTPYSEGSTDGYFNVDIQTCKYDDGSFSIDTEATNHGITNNNGKFQLNNDYADSLEGTFTLLDVQFMDPMHPKTSTSDGLIAYHLYVPVYTVREMAVKFYTSAKTGAYSVPNPGTNQYWSLINECVAEEADPSITKPIKRQHADTLNTWVTQYIRYEYSATDIRALLYAGNVKWNYNKTINFETVTNGTDKNRLPDGTYMILVDPNGNSDQAYYTTVNSSNLTHYTITDSETEGTTKNCWGVPLTAFKAEDYDGNDANNVAFSVPTINDVIASSIVYTENTSGTGRYQRLTPTDLQRETEDFDYDVYTIENGVKQYYEFRNAKNGNADLDISTSVYEDYYISIKVPDTAVVTATDVYYYKIKIPSTRLQITDIAGSNSSPKTAGLTQQNQFQVLIADLFNQTGSMEVAPDVQQITTTNHIITANLTTVVTPKNSTAILYLNGDEFFHSYYITLIRTSEKGIESDINALRASNVTATYKINGGTASSCENVDLNLEANYLNVQTTSEDDSATLIGYLTSTGSFTISSEIVMNFDQDELQNEFPKRSTGEEYGVNVRAASNIAYETSNLVNTSMTSPYPLDRHNYYIETVKTATLKYNPNADEIDTIYDTIGYNSKNQTTLGVNGLSADNCEPTARTDMPVYTEAFYNVQSVSDEDISEAKVLKLTFKLEKKTDSEGNPVPDADYEAIANMQNYINGNITFKSNNAEVTAEATGSTVTVYLDVEQCAPSGKLFDIDISFNAKSGGSFREYANYKIDLKAELYKTALRDAESGKITGVINESIITSSPAEDYLIYTNAKINPEFIRIQQSEGNEGN